MMIFPYFSLIALQDSLMNRNLVTVGRCPKFGPRLLVSEFVLLAFDLYQLKSEYNTPCVETGAIHKVLKWCFAWQCDRRAKKPRNSSQIHDEKSIIFLDSVPLRDNSKTIIKGGQSNREILSEDYEERFRFNGAFEKGYLHPIDGSFKRKRGFIKGKDLPVLGPYYYDLEMKHPR